MPSINLAIRESGIVMKQIWMKKNAFSSDLTSFKKRPYYLRSRRQVKHFPKYLNVKILSFCGYIWYHHKKCIQISTNMPGIGLVIRETDETNLKKTKHSFSLHDRTNDLAMC